MRIQKSFRDLPVDTAFCTLYHSMAPPTKTLLVACSAGIGLLFSTVSADAGLPSLHNYVGASLHRPSKYILGAGHEPGHRASRPGCSCGLPGRCLCDGFLIGWHCPTFRWPAHNNNMRRHYELRCNLLLVHEHKVLWKRCLP